MMMTVDFNAQFIIFIEIGIFLSVCIVILPP